MKSNPNLQADITFRTDVQMVEQTLLREYSDNPRVHSEEQVDQIANAMKKWGWTLPILVDETYTVIAGHGRLKAGIKLGLKEVPVIVADGWSEEDKRAYVIADNQLALNSDWDTQKHIESLKILSDSGFEMNLIGSPISLSYQPLEPILTTGKVVSDKDIETSMEGLSDKIENLSDAPNKNAKKIMCPYCTETFEINL